MSQPPLAGRTPARAALLGLALLTAVCADVANAQPYTFTHLAGALGGVGSNDGAGSAARFNRPAGIAIDGTGTVYIADTVNHTIRKMSPSGLVTTVAGTPGAAGGADGTGSAARFRYPNGIAVDGAGNLFVADTWNHTIRKVTPAGVVTTIAGTAGQSGSTDGPGAAARFYVPLDLDVDASGTVYVADTGNATIRRVLPSGAVTTVAGSPGVEGSADGTGAAAHFNGPSGIALDANGNAFVADSQNHTIRKISAGAVVTTFAGTAGRAGSTDGTGSAARFVHPMGVSVDVNGGLVVADTSDQTIRRITPAAVVTTSAGAPTVSGSVDGTGGSARFAEPQAIVVAANSTAFVLDTSNSTVRTVTSLGVVTTVAGLAGGYGSVDATGVAARFWGPKGTAVDTSGNLYVSDTLNQTIRRITPAGVVTTLAGAVGIQGTADGTGSAARFNNPAGLALDAAGILYVADSGNHAIRKVTSAGVVTTLAGTPGSPGFVNATGTAARFNFPMGVAVDTAGILYVADAYNHVIRRVTAQGVVSTFAGSGVPGYADGTIATASFNYPWGVAVAPNGTVFIADLTNNAVRRVLPGGGVTTLAGSPAAGYLDGIGTAARFYAPESLALLPGGDLVVSDTSNRTLRRVTQAGVVTTLAGAGIAGSEDGSGPAARFFTPSGVSADASGAVYVADAANNAVRRGSQTPVFTLTVVGAGNGVGTITSQGGLVPSVSCTTTAGALAGTCAQTYVYGLAVTLTASPAPGSTFSSWSNCPAPSGPQCTVYLIGPQTVTATFQLSNLPTLSAVVPTSGSTAGGTFLTFTGSGFVSGQTTITACGLPLIGVDGTSATTIVGTTPAGTVGVCDVTMTTPFGSTTLPGAFTYESSVTRMEVSGDAPVIEPSLDFKGRYLAFASQASNLVAQDTNGLFDVFVRDRDTGQTRRLSVGPNGVEADGASRRPRISDDGRYVAFVSQATNLVAGDTNGFADIFVADRDSDGDGVYDEPGDPAIVRVGPATGPEPNGASRDPDLSPDGAWVGFVSDATNLVPGDTNALPDVFVVNWKTGDTTLVSHAPGGQPANGPSRAPAVGTGAKIVVFASDASNLTTGDTNNVRDVFRLERETGLMTRISNVHPGTSSLLLGGALSFTTNARIAPAISAYEDGDADEPDVSADGEEVVYQQPNADPCNGNSVIDIVLASPASLASPYLCVTQGPGGQASNGGSTDPTISSDGGTIAWNTDATNQTSDPDTNGEPDVMQWTTTDPEPERLSENQSGTQFDGGSTQPAVSGNGENAAMSTTNPSTNRDEIVVVSRPLRLDSIFGVSGPPAGPLAGGTAVDLRGSGFTNRTEVWFGGTRSAGVTFVSGDRVLAVSPPAGAAGFVEVKAKAPDGSVAKLPAAFEYQAVPPALQTDTDGDGLLDQFENDFGLDPDSPAGNNGAGGDPDGDGIVNSVEQEAGSHPRGTFLRYFAEGATGFFETEFRFANPTAEPAHVLVRMQKDDGTQVSLAPFVLQPFRSTRRAIRQLKVAGLQDTSFSTIVESDVAIAADRRMSWGTLDGYGSHAERALTAPARTWYLAEGATHSGFQTFYLIQNPNPATVTVQVTYLLPAPKSPIVKTYPLAPLKRLTIWLNFEAGLSNVDVSGVVETTTGAPIIVERAMYRDGPYAPQVRPFNAGHESAGVTTPGTEWFVAEGATGPEFDTFYLLANPTSTPATVEVTYLPEGAPAFTLPYQVAPMSRRTIWVDFEDPRLAATAVSARVRSTNGVPILLERAMWWPGNAASWQEGHDSTATPVTGTTWVTSDGVVTTPFSADTFVLIANTSPWAGVANVTLLMQNGTPVTRTYALPPSSRKTVWVRLDFPMATDQDFGVLVESVPATAGATPAQIVVEEAIYNNALQVTSSGAYTGAEEIRAAGSVSLATRIK